MQGKAASDLMRLESIGQESEAVMSHHHQHHLTPALSSPTNITEHVSAMTDASTFATSIPQTLLLDPSEQSHQTENGATLPPPIETSTQFTASGEQSLQRSSPTRRSPDRSTSRTGSPTRTRS